MAAGLSIKKVHLERFKVIFDKFVASSVSDYQLNRKIVSDGQLENQFLTKELGIPEEKLFITVHKNDHESEKYWLENIGIKKEKIARLGDCLLYTSPSPRDS